MQLLFALRSCKRASKHLIRAERLYTTNTTTRKYPPKVGSKNYEEGDRVLVTHKQGRNLRVKLLPPLRKDGSTRTGRHSCEIKHNEIIGQPAERLFIEAENAENGRYKDRFRVKHPTLEEFVSLAPRTVTPIYASYSAFITNLLDIHVSPPTSNDVLHAAEASKLEILEAGTGHGSLTLHLARAIAAANPPCPTNEAAETPEELAEVWTSWRKQRKAILHTIEYVEPRSKDASKLVRSFRGGLYWPHIDFHAGDVGEWVEKEQNRRRQGSSETPQGASEDQFLDIVCLDMPEVHKKIQHVVQAMKDNAQLLVYVPQITQLAACQQEISRLGLPLKMDRVLELGEGISNGRDWDLRFVTPRKELKREQEQESDGANTEEGEVEQDTEEDSLSFNAGSLEEASTKVLGSEAFPTMVCRPLVGKLIMGGAFIGLWHKKEYKTSVQTSFSGSKSTERVE